MAARSLALAGLLSLAGLAFGTAPALDEQADALPQQSALEGIHLTEGEPGQRGLSLSWRDDAAPRYSEVAGGRSGALFNDNGERRNYEVAFAAPGVAGGLDIAVAQRASVTVDRNGDIGRAGAGAELRLGRNLGDIVRPWRQQREGSWYVFLASDGQALTWTAENALPGQRGLRLQDRVTIGDTQIGVSYERWGVQTSFALTQREVSYTNAAHGWSEDESFAGVTLTWRH